MKERIEKIVSALVLAFVPAFTWGFAAWFIENDLFFGIGFFIWNYISNIRANICHFLLLTGGRPTCSNSIFFDTLGGWWKVDAILVDKKSEDVPRIEIPHKEIKERVMSAINNL